MTFKEAVEEMAKREKLGFRTVEYEVAFHTPIPSRRCKLYGENFGGIIISAASWDEAFKKLDAKIVAITPSPKIEIPGQEPTEEGSKDDIPF